MVIFVSSNELACSGSVSSRISSGVIGCLEETRCNGQMPSVFRGVSKPDREWADQSTSATSGRDAGNLSEGGDPGDN